LTLATLDLERPVTPARAFPWARLRWLPLAAILAAQAILSARIMIGKQASPDEARYIIAGHQLIYELWHGGGSPYYETYFSGAPDIYSPLAAMADHLGGLAEVRLMSLAFMLAATCVLFLTTRRLFGYWAAVMATGLFASLGLAHDVGVYGSYDSLALMFIASATYGAVRSREARWLLAVPLLLLAANASKYMTLVFDPVVIGVAALQAGTDGWRHVTRRVLVLGATTSAVLVLAVCLAGIAYVKGIEYTTVDRNSHNPSFSGRFPAARYIVWESWHWTGLIMVLAGLSVLVCLWRERDWTRAALLGLLTFAGVLVTLEALHLHSDQSMRQHDTFGGWFGAIAGGYVLSAALSPARRWRNIPAMGLATAVIAASWVYNTSIDRADFEGGCGNSGVCLSGGLISSGFYDVALPYLRQPHGRLLIGYLAFGMSYDARVNIPWWRLGDDIYLKYPIPGRGGDSHGQTNGRVCFRLKPRCMYLEGPAAYRAAIHAHWFSFISLYKDHDDSVQDKVIIQAVEHTPGYVVLTRIGTSPTWIYLPAYRALLTHARDRT
jgi:hypothetical protein